MVLSTETCFHWASAWFWKEGWLSCALTSFMQTPVDSRGRDHSASPSFPQSESPWPALLANTIRWNQNHCRSYLSWAASQKYIGGFYILIKCSNINTIFASSQLLPSEHSQLGLRKFLWFWLNTNVVNFTVTVWPMPFLSPSHLHLPRTSPHPDPFHLLQPLYWHSRFGNQLTCPHLAISHPVVESEALSLCFPIWNSLRRNSVVKFRNALLT